MKRNSIKTFKARTKIADKSFARRSKVKRKDLASAYSQWANKEVKVAKAKNKFRTPEERIAIAEAKSRTARSLGRQAAATAATESIARSEADREASRSQAAMKKNEAALEMYRNIITGNAGNSTGGSNQGGSTTDILGDYGF